MKAVVIESPGRVQIADETSQKWKAQKRAVEGQPEGVVEQSSRKGERCNREACD